MLSCICIFLSCFHVVLHVFVWLFFSFALFCFTYKKNKKKIEKSEKYKNSVCFVYIDICVPWMTIETKFSKLCIFCSLDEHLYAQLIYAQLSKWALWLLFVMSKVELSLILNSYHSFWREELKNPERKALITISPLIPANHKMTPICFGIAKVQCQWHLYVSA